MHIGETTTRLANVMERSVNGVNIGGTGFSPSAVDTPPRAAPDYLKRFEADLAGVAGVRIATISGRYFAMDRDKRWDRVALAYEAMVDGRGDAATTPSEAVDRGYAAGLDDEFVKPTVIGSYDGMKDGDGVLMFNYRSDRAREILTALLDPMFDGFRRARLVRFAAAVGMAACSWIVPIVIVVPSGSRWGSWLPKL